MSPTCEFVWVCGCGYMLILGAGKLVLYFGSRLFGYNATACSYANIHDPYGPDCKFVVLRMISAAFGSATAPLLYGIVRNFGGSVSAAVFTTLMYILDGLNVGEARLILIDSQLIFWCAAALFCAQLWWTRWNVHWDAVWEFEKISGQAFTLRDALGWGAPTAAPPGQQAAKDAAYAQALARARKDTRIMSWQSRLVWVVVIGLVCANAVSIKFTALATPGFIAVESFCAFFFLRRALPLPDLVGIAGVVIAAFVSYYDIHFSILRNAGDGDGFMSWEFQRTLRGNAHFDPNAEFPALLPLVYDVC